MTRVYVLGNAVTDVSLTIERAARPGESILARSIVRAPGGKGLNQAVAAGRAGAEVVFVSALGTDASGSELAGALAREPFAALRMLQLPVATDMSILTVTADGENAIVTTVGCLQAVPPEALQDHLHDLLPGDYLLMQGNLSSAVTGALAEHARARGARVVVNAAPWHWDGPEVLQRCEGVIANEGEMIGISGMADVEAGAAWLLARGPAWVIVTLGARGCLLVDAAGSTRHGGVPADVRDTSGAGDVFCGVLVAGLAAGEPLARAITAAQGAAALTVERSGTYLAIPSVEELAAAMG